MYPERYRVEEFPAERELERLGGYGGFSPGGYDL
jgi:hypothetical protein